MAAKDSYILHIEWDRPTSAAPKLPPDVGPFKTRDEAEQWAHLNIGSGTWEIWPLAWPYYVSEGLTCRH